MDNEETQEDTIEEFIDYMVRPGVMISVGTQDVFIPNAVVLPIYQALGSHLKEVGWVEE